MAEKDARRRQPGRTAEKITVAGRVEPEINRYYLRVSHKFMAAAVVILLVLVLYIMCITLFFGEYVTYDNLRYLLRDMDAMSIGGQESFEKIVYNATGSAGTEYFRNGLAICDTDKYRYYDTSGVLLIEEDLGYENPVMAVSDKYMLVYDLDGTGYSVFNQLTRIIERQADGDIVAAGISPDGSYVLAMRSSETRYVVELYNGAFSKVLSIYKDNYVLDTAVSKDGNTVVICSACPADSDFDCEIDICRRGKQESVKKLTYTHAFPLEVCAADDGFAVLCSSRIVFFDEDGENLKEKSFSGMSLKYADINGVTAAVTGSTNALGSENRVIVMDMTDNFGDVLFDKTFGMRIMGIYASRDTKKSLAYLKLHDTVASLGSEGEIVNENTAGEIISVVPMNNGALICQRTSAYRVFDE